MSSVLVVDDEMGIRLVLERWLTSGGYDVRTAEGADAALVEMTRSPADVVMCDVMMPGHDGLWLAGELRSRFPAAAVILATGLDSVPPASSMQPGIVGYIVKPFEPDDVRKRVAEAVKWHADALARPAAPADGDPLGDWLAARDD